MQRLNRLLRAKLVEKAEPDAQADDCEDNPRLGRLADGGRDDRRDIRTDPVQSASRLPAGKPVLAAAETSEHRVRLEDRGRRKTELCARTRRGEVDRLDADCRFRYANQAGC